MPPDFRAVLRKFDDFMKRGVENDALNYVQRIISEFDKERDYSSAINILSHVIDKITNPIARSKLVSHLIVRALLTGDILKAKEYQDLLVSLPEVGISKIMKNVLQSREESSNYEFILEGIEKQSIFGVFESLTEIPIMEFENENTVFTTIEDFYSHGRYIVNLIQTTSHFHHSIDVDIGNAIDVNIVEKRRIMKLD